MKNITIKLSAILMMLGVFAIASFGQKTERVKFDKGATEGTFTRTIPAEGSMDFVINAKAGQYMDYTPAYDLKKNDIQAVLTEPNLQDVSQTAKIDERNVFAINTSGDHRLTVNNMTRKSVTFTLYLSITNNDPDRDDSNTSSGGNDDGNDRIDFAGADPSGVELSMELRPGETRQYVAYVKKGYTVCVETNGSSGQKIVVEVDTVVIDSCSKNTTKAGDQNIFFTNKGNKKIAFTATVKSFN